jgi:hypothetical protein
MPGWIVQKYRMRPGFVSLSDHDSPRVKVGDEANVGPDAYVTLCGASSRLVQVTVSPTLTWIVGGLKLMFAITTLTVPGAVPVVAAAVLETPLARDRARLDAVLELAPPHPASAKTATGRTTAEKRFIENGLPVRACTGGRSWFAPAPTFHDVKGWAVER